jgi:hypothetical protein
MQQTEVCRYPTDMCLYPELCISALSRLSTFGTASPKPGIRPYLPTVGKVALVSMDAGAKTRASPMILAGRWQGSQRPMSLALTPAMPQFSLGTS